MANAGAGTPSQAAMRQKEVLKACMTCPICNELLDEPTLISECLHTFCRRCIFEKLTDEEVECCPVCNIHLGCVPVEKLRHDQCLQDVIAIIFPQAKRKVDAPKVPSVSLKVDAPEVPSVTLKVDAPEVPSVSLPVRRRERSVSSLVVNTPRVGTQSGLTGRRTKASARRAAGSRGSSHVIAESAEKEEVDRAENSDSLETMSKIYRNRSQKSSDVEASNKRSGRAIENGEIYGNNAGLLRPSNCLVEAAKTKSPAIKVEQTNGSDADLDIPKTKLRKHPNKSTDHGDENGDIPTSIGLAKSRRLRGNNQKAKEQAISTAQAIIDAAGGQHERRTSPVWFSLIASSDQDGDAPLPQVSANYLRVKDGNLPASFIRKYLVKKLDLASETEEKQREIWQQLYLLRICSTYIPCGISVGVILFLCLLKSLSSEFQRLAASGLDGLTQSVSFVLPVLALMRVLMKHPDFYSSRFEAFAG